MIILLIIGPGRRFPLTDRALRSKAFTSDHPLVYQGVSLTLSQTFQLEGTTIPGYEFHVHHDGKQAGIMTLLVNDNFDTSFVDGNLGINIFPEYRGQDLPVKAAFAALPVFKHHHQKQYLMSFYEHNSLLKIFQGYIKQLGGRQLDKVDMPEGTVIRNIIDIK